MHNTSNLQADGLQRQKTMSGSTSVSQLLRHSGHSLTKTRQLKSGQTLHTHGRVRIRRQQHESMDPTCLGSKVQAGGGGVMVWGMFSWHTSGLLIPINHCLNATVHLSIVADLVHPYSTIMRHVTKQK